jgi:hypothetical protein
MPDQPVSKGAVKLLQTNVLYHALSAGRRWLLAEDNLVLFRCMSIALGRADQASMPVLSLSFIRRADWLLDTKTRVPDAIADQLKNGLFSSLPIFLGGVLNATAVASIAAWRHPTAPFLGWLLFEICLGLVRMGVLIHGKRRMAAGQTPPRTTSALLSCLWAVSVGIGTSLCILSGDWILATIACAISARPVWPRRWSAWRWDHVRSRAA